MILILIAAAIILAAVAGWLANDLATGRRLRRRLRRGQDQLQQKLVDHDPTTQHRSNP